MSASYTRRRARIPVDLTIQRWLELQPDFQLELERGEDVDTIHQAMNMRGRAQARLLEQIKAREKNVTLRSYGQNFLDYPLVEGINIHPFEDTGCTLEAVSSIQAFLKYSWDR